MSSLTELDNENPEIVALRRTARDLAKQLGKHKVRTAEIVEAVHRAATDSIITLGRPASPKKPAADKRKKNAEICLVHTTDWQVGKETSTYNSKMAWERLVDMFCSKIEKLVEIQRADHPVRDAAYLYGGDMVEGIGIFPGQAWGVDSTLFAQLFATANIMEAQLRHALTVFQTVNVFVEKGNHGRYGKKGEAPSGDNFDLIAYAIVKERLVNEARLVWHPMDKSGVYTNVVLGNYKALLFHGDEVKSFGGNTPAFGIMRKLTAWAAGVAPEFTDAYGGHYHTHMQLPLPAGGSIYMTGSPESDNEYATEFVAAKGFPSQRINFIDPEKGRVTSEHKVWLD